MESPAQSAGLVTLKSVDVAHLLVHLSLQMHGAGPLAYASFAAAAVAVAAAVVGLRGQTAIVRQWALFGWSTQSPWA